MERCCWHIKQKGRITEEILQLPIAQISLFECIYVFGLPLRVRVQLANQLVLFTSWCYLPFILS